MKQEERQRVMRMIVDLDLPNHGWVERHGWWERAAILRPGHV